VTLVYNVLTTPEGRPLQRQTARFTLRAPGNPFTDITSQVIQQHAEDTDGTGRWEADLIPNSQFEMDGTYYHVDQRDGLRLPDMELDFVVPDVGGPYWVRDLLVIPPTPGTPFPPLPPHALGDHTDVDTTGAAFGDYLRYDGTEWVPSAGGGGSGGTGFQQAVPNLTNTVPVPHLLGYRPSVSLFSADWHTQYTEFNVDHIDANNLTVSTDPTPFAGWVVAS
jgi:hypothetical protein